MGKGMFFGHCGGGLFTAIWADEIPSLFHAELQKPTSERGSILPILHLAANGYQFSSGSLQVHYELGFKRRFKARNFAALDAALSLRATD